MRLVTERGGKKRGGFCRMTGKERGERDWIILFQVKVDAISYLEKRESEKTKMSSGGGKTLT